MVGKQVRRMDEGLMMMQELEDHLKEQIDRLEHVRLAAAELKENLFGVRGFRKNTKVESSTFSLFTLSEMI